MRDYYELLGAERDATHDELQTAYRAQAERWHPDRVSRGLLRAPGADGFSIYDEAALQMRLLNEAWDALGDPSQRARYDATLRSPSPKRGQTGLVEPPAGFILAPRYGGIHAIGLFRHIDLIRGAVSLVAESSGLGSLSQLEDGDVWSIDAAEHAVGDADLAVLRRFPSLKALDLADTRVTDLGLHHLAGIQLVDLVLAGTHITDAGVPLLAGITSLRTLSLFGSAVTDAGVTALEGHPRLAMLDLRRTRVGGPALTALASLPRLAELRLPRVRRADRTTFTSSRPDVVLL